MIIFMLGISFMKEKGCSLSGCFVMHNIIDALFPTQQCHQVTKGP